MNLRKLRLLVVVFVALLSLAAPAQSIFDFEEENSDKTIEAAYHIKDPLESLNRKIYHFNYLFDKRALRPTSKLYKDYAPEPMQDGIHNFIRNLKMPLMTATSLLTFDFNNSMRSFSAFIINSSFGMMGFFNIAKQLDISPLKQNFATAFAHYNLPQGIYLVVPFVGPQTTRSFTGMIFDTILDPVSLYNYDQDHYLYTLQITNKTLEALDFRAQNFELINDLYDNSFDSYIRARNIFYQTQ